MSNNLFERLIFDLILWAANAIVMEVDPAEAFAPLKKAAEGDEPPAEQPDTPEWVKAQMVARARRWLRRAGAEVGEHVRVEICPLWALDVEEVSEKVNPGTRVEEATYLH